MRKMYRQGDVLLLQVEGPNAEKALEPAQETPRALLAEGEVTGHMHELWADKMKWIPRTQEEIDKGMNMLVRLETPGTLTHQEHGTLAIDPGTYAVIRQREWDITAPRTVVD